MMTREQVADALKDRRISHIARDTGLSRPAIQRIRDGSTAHPSYAVIKALSDYFTKQEDKK